MTCKGNSQETKEFARDMTVEFHGQDPNNYKAEVDTSSISLFMPHLIEYIKYFVSVLSKVFYSFSLQILIKSIHFIIKWMNPMMCHSNNIWFCPSCCDYWIV